MDREISSGAMLGIVLLALAAVIALGFGVFAITKGVANEGTVNVQDSLNSVSMQVFLDYDQKVVSGQQVTSAIKQFEGKPYAILIQTKALDNGSKIASEGDRPEGAYAVEDDNGNIFINYGALVANNAEGAKPAKVNANTAVNSGAKLLKMDNGSYIIEHGLSAENGVINFDNATAGVFKRGNAEYVSTNSKFEANLVKDASGNIFGIAVKQL